MRQGTECPTANSRQPNTNNARAERPASLLNELFGDQTFFLNSDGLNVVEPKAGARAATVVNLANWTDVHLTSLAPHEPEPTEIIVMLETEH